MHIRSFVRLACTLIPAALAATTASAGITLDPAQIQKIDKVFEQYDQPGSPGCALGIMSDGRIIYARGYGEATLDPPTAIDSRKLFDIASMSKQFAAASMVLLAQQGRIKLDDDVRKYIPELRNYGKTITINNLLWHTSGLRDYNLLLLLASFDYPEITTEKQALDLVIRQQKLDFVPGTKYAYSNTGYFLMSVIVKRVSGLSLNDFSKRNFFTPLGMPLSVFRDKFDRPIPNQALGYSFNGDTKAWEVYMSNWEQVGDGGLQTSVEELQKWDENFYSGQVGGPEFIAEMLKQGRLENGRQLTYARGLQVNRYRGLDRVEHGGDWIGYHSNIERFPGVHTTIALLCNVEEAQQYELSEQVVDIALEKVFTEPKPSDPEPAPSLPQDRFLGEYYSKDLQQVYKITHDDETGGLAFNYLSIVFPLESLGPTSFRLLGIPSTSIEFSVNGNLPADAMTFTVDKDDPDRIPDRANRFTAPPLGDVTPYLGRYHSDELQQTWSIVIDKDGAFALSSNEEAHPLGITGALSPVSQDSFYGIGGYLQFVRDSAGRVTEFRLSYNATKDYRFTRN